MVLITMKRKGEHLIKKICFYLYNIYYLNPIHLLRIFITLEFEIVYVTDYLNGVKLTSQKINKYI